MSYHFFVNRKVLWSQNISRLLTQQSHVSHESFIVEESIKILLNSFIYYFVCISVLSVYICTMCIMSEKGIRTSEIRVSDSYEPSCGF